MIKNKDGSEFKLKGPNPAMQEQELWTEFTPHNLVWDGLVTEDKAQTQQSAVTFKVKDFIGELEESKPVETVEAETLPPEETIDLPSGITPVRIHCLPATIRVRIDPLYGEKGKTIQYGTPFVFGGVVVNAESDTAATFWTMESKVTEGSVLYPQTEEKRWWRVKYREEKTGGWILGCTYSDYQPAFQ